MLIEGTAPWKLYNARRRMRRKIRVTSNLEVRDETLEVRVKSNLE